MENPDSTQIKTAEDQATQPETLPPQARLICTDPALDSSLERLEIDLIDAEQTIGRADTNTVVINYMRVSRHHARIYPHNGEWMIEDVSSTNGIYIYDEPTSKAILEPGAHINIASIPFRFELVTDFIETFEDEEAESVDIPRTVKKQLNQNPEATIIIQNSPYLGSSDNNTSQQGLKYGLFVAIFLIVLLTSGVIASVSM